MANESTAAECYREAARRHGEATESGNYEQANAAHDQLVEALAELKTIAGGLGVLEALLDDHDSHVRCWAATHLLPTVPERAAAALEELSQEPGIAGFDAKQVLKEWKAGRL